MSEPLVCAIMLVDGRPEMVKRAVASFRARSYCNAEMLLFNTALDGRDACDEYESETIHAVWCPGMNGRTIGALRNYACDLTGEALGIEADIICHWDSDDWSGTQRIAEQVALLDATGADCCGYREAVFWDTRPGQFCGAWVYRSPDTSYAIGASLMYWRKTWERVPFDDVNIAEDRRFTLRVKTVGVSAIEDISGFSVNVPQVESTLGGWFGPSDTHRRYISGPPEVSIGKGKPCGPRLICSIHGSNTADYSKFSKQVWRREPALDVVCRERMAL